MSVIADIDSIIDTEDQDLLGTPDDFPEALIMISLGNNRYAAVNATTPGPDPMVVNVLAVFASEQQASMWEQIWKLSGEHVNKQFQEARDIARSKPDIWGLGLQINGNTGKIHWIK